MKLRTGLLEIVMDTLMPVDQVNEPAGEQSRITRAGTALFFRSDLIHRGSRLHKGEFHGLPQPSTAFHGPPLRF